MVRTIYTSISSRALANQISLAEGARSAVMVPSQSASTVLSVEVMNSVHSILYQSAVDPIESRERVLAAQFRMMMGILPQSAAVAVSRQSIKQPVGLMASGSHAPPTNPRCSIIWKGWFSLSTHSHGNMAFAFIRWILGTKNSWKAARHSTRPPPIIRYSLSSLHVPDTL
jgi:hypothetical protein